MEYSTKFISINEQIDEAVYSLYTYSTFIFVSAVFSDIPAEFQNAAKNMLGGFIADAKKSMSPSVGNGLHLIQGQNIF